jgi:RNA polymerase I-specific transcription initiation factor RRN7
MQDDDNEKVAVPGESFTIFNARDIFGILPNEYVLVVGRAGRWAGVSDEYLSGVVENYERRVVRWWEGDKRR